MPEDMSLTHKRSSQRRPLSLLFTTEPDDESFFRPPELGQRQNLITHLIQHSDQLLLLLADQGSGKSTLLQQIKREANEDWKLLCLAGHPGLNEESLLKQILMIFNMRSEGKTPTALVETLRSHVAATRYNHQLPVLLVDDAHMLPLKTLHVLLDLVMKGEKQTRLRVVLFCEPQMTSVLAANEFSQVRNTLIHTLDIPALSEKQVGEYLRFRLAEGRYVKNNPFSGMTVRKLYEASEGRLGRLNPLAQNIINQQLEEQLQHREDMPADTSKWYKLMWVLMLVGLFVGLLFGLQWVKQQWFDSPAVAHTEDLNLPSPLPLDAAESTLPVTQLNPDLLKPTTPEENHSDVDVTASAASLLPENPLDSAENTTHTLTDSPTSLDESASAKANTLAIQRLEPAPRIPSEDSVIAGVKSAFWLSQQNAQHYSLQILGSYTLEGVSRFIRKYPLEGELALYLSTHKNRDWYVLTYGIYPNREQAKQALKQLPSSLRAKTKPWLRPVSTIQQAITGRSQIKD